MGRSIIMDHTENYFYVGGATTSNLGGNHSGNLDAFVAKV